jgi:hypothetical protein
VSAPTVNSRTRDSRSASSRNTTLFPVPGWPLISKAFDISGYEKQPIMRRIPEHAIDFRGLAASRAFH